MRRIVVALVLVLASACKPFSKDDTGAGTSAERAANAAASPLAGAHLTLVGAGAEGGTWTMAAGDYANTRYSGLDQIQRANAKDLRVAFTFDTGVERGQEAAPLVVGTTMYLVTPFPNRLHALDLSREGAPLKWTYEPRPEPAAQGVACCDVVNRGAAYWEGTIIYNTLDAHTVAVDAETGRELWKTKLGDVHKGETMTMAPLVVKGKVLVGNSGGELGVRGWLTALDARTGAIAWRAYSTGPDADVRIGPAFKPFYAQDRGVDLGVKTWPPERWRTGGGTAWGFVSYDPELDLVYYGTANPGPWNAEQRPGDNKWTAGIFARRPETGEAVWFYQWSPHDLYDYDGVNESVLLDAVTGGRTRKLLVHPDRNGYLYVLDRATGEVLSAPRFAHVTTSSGVDLATGLLKYEPSKQPHVGAVVRDICPAAPGAKDWQPSAFSPRTGLLYLPHNNLCQDEEDYDANYIAGTPFVGARVRMVAGPGGHRGEFAAWDPVAGTKAWGIKDDFPVWSGALATAGDVVFYGTMEGFFRALDARTGEKLFEQKLDSGVVGQPMTYLGPDGKQYVAILSGVGGWPGIVAANRLDPRDQGAALGFAHAMKDLPRRTKVGGKLYAFALP